MGGGGYRYTLISSSTKKTLANFHIAMVMKGLTSTDLLWGQSVTLEGPERSWSRIPRRHSPPAGKPSKTKTSPSCSWPSPCRRGTDRFRASGTWRPCCRTEPTPLPWCSRSTGSYWLYPVWPRWNCHLTGPVEKYGYECDVTSLYYITHPFIFC